jgi:hypothetical protein
MKYLLCRPAGGFNDNLNQIYFCLEYCNKYNRILLIDTKYSKKYNFCDFFTFIDDNNIIYDSSEIKKLILENNFTTYPSILKNKLYDYDFCFQDKNINGLGFYYNETYLGLNMTKDYDEEIVLHHNCGGNVYGPVVLSYLTINDPIINIITSRYNKIEKPYFSVHIRNTDYKTDYIDFFNDNKKDIIENNIFLASDSKEVIEYFKNMKQNNLYNFIEKINDNNKPIHHFDSHNDGDITVIFIDLLCDLVILSLAKNFILPKKYFGFTRLAYHLFKNKDIVHKLTKDSFI